MTHFFFPSIFLRNIQSFVTSCSIIVVRRPTRLKYCFLNCDGVIFRNSAASSISGFVIQINPCSGPEQHCPQPRHSKCNPATYHEDLFFNDILPLQNCAGIGAGSHRSVFGEAAFCNTWLRCFPCLFAFFQLGLRQLDFYRIFWNINFNYIAVFQ